MTNNKHIAKSVPIVKVLASMGIKPEKVVGSQIVYYSPFRTEHTPSFFVSPQKNVYKDFGGEGGDVIKLVMNLKNYDFKNALNYLLEFDDSTLDYTDIEKQALKAKKKNQLELLKFDSVESKYLLNYALSRGIDAKIVQKYCYEVTYLNNQRMFTSLGFLNNSDGFELRLNNFQSCIGKKDISIVWGTKNHRQVRIFEGFFDFLSHQQEYQNNPSIDETTSIILNSVNNLNKFDLDDFNIIYLFLDNDKAGIQTKDRIIEQNKGKTIIDCSTIYKGFKDYNEYIISK